MDTEVPIEARTRVETTEDSVDLDIGGDGEYQPRGRFDGAVQVGTLILFALVAQTTDFNLYTLHLFPQVLISYCPEISAPTMMGHLVQAFTHPLFFQG